ncbi:MAG: hypothetical protein J6B80_08005 [Clostridia bacterium]|nr:hypothetical protein [Clostridia bacterium]
MNKTTFGILTLLFNALGVPCFIQGNAKSGILRIVLNFVTCGIIGFINGIMGIILAIEIFKMTDEEFEEKKGTITKGIPA